MSHFLVLSFFVASVSFTISVTSIFSWLRELVAKIHPKLEELIFCPYCLGHYICLITLGILNPDIPVVTTNGYINFLIIWLSIMTPVSLFHYVMLRAYQPVAETMSYRKWVKDNPDKAQ
jgi:hypothetical protein